MFLPVSTISQIFSFLLAFLITVLGGVNPEDQFARPCMPRDFGRGSIVCVCNSTYCDSAASLLTPAPASGRGFWNGNEEVKRGLVQIYTSSKSGQRLHKSSRHFNDGGEEGESGLTTTLEQSTPLLDYTIYGNELDARRRRRVRQPQSRTRRFLQILKSDFPRPHKISKLTVRRRMRYQEILGIGGSFTDAAGLNIAALSYGAQENLMKSYFGGEGNDYSMGRVPIGGSDFSSRPYTYDDVPFPDTNLTHFSLQPEDYTLKMPYMEWALRLSEGKLRLVASPWSAPGWMKTNKRLNGAGVLRKEYYQVWADYFLRFIRSYRKHGIPIWAVTTGNEPFNGFIPKFPFNCMGWTAADASKWIANNLGPTLRSAQSEFGDVKIIMMDDNKAVVPTWAKEILENSEASQYVSGVGTHWYFDFLTSLDVLSRFHAKYPDYFIVQTEACLGFTPWELEKVILGSWERAEMYLGAIINDMRNWVGGWIDWNLALDLQGGPNWAKWAADAAILVNPKTDEFFKQPIYYGIGHVSKFVPPGSVRIEMSGELLPKNLQSVAFLRPDNGTVVVFLNKLSYDAKVSLYDEDRGSLFLQIPARSIQTLVYW